MLVILFYERGSDRSFIDTFIDILMIVRVHNVDLKYPFILYDPLNRIYIFPTYILL